MKNLNKSLLIQECCGGGRHRGMTIIELLVAIAVIGLLVAVLIPAVQGAREAARRTDCVSHLRSLSQACKNFESRHGRLPSGHGPRSGRNSGLAWSVQAHILGDLEASDLHRSLDFSGQPSADNPVLRVRIPLFLCPSDSLPRGTNYVANAGVSHHTVDLDELKGPFSDIDEISLSQIADGTSNTAEFSERLGTRVFGEAFDVRTDAWFSGSSLLEPISTAETQSICNSLIGPPFSYYPFVGRDWICSGLGTSLYNHVESPNRGTNCFSSPLSEVGPSDWIGGTAAGIMRPSSNHAGGVNLVMVDGSVRFVSSDVAHGVWKAWGTIAGRERDVAP